ncbi:hypothetical protein FACS1894147_06340 [Spirochaetia bacterium]|nr:hypothetical protein FACS1894147_06340 [Spirochaetia bacterium]
MLLLLAFAIPLCYGQTEVDNLLSLDLTYSAIGLLNHGGGIGFSCEKKINSYLSAAGAFGHMTFLTGMSDVYCTSVHISLFGNYYPFGDGLDKLYISTGGGADFMNYFGNGDLPDTTKDTVLSITAKTGWKFRPLANLMIDVFLSYKYIIVDSENYRGITDYLNGGLQYGIGFKLLFNKRKEND